MRIDKIVTTPISAAPALVEVPVRTANVMTSLWFSVEQCGPNEYQVTEVESRDWMIFSGDEEMTYLIPDINPATEVELFLAAVNAGLLPEENI